MESKISNEYIEKEEIRSLREYQNAANEKKSIVNNLIKLKDQIIDIERLEKDLAYFEENKQKNAPKITNAAVNWLELIILAIIRIVVGIISWIAFCAVLILFFGSSYTSSTSYAVIALIVLVLIIIYIIYCLIPKIKTLIKNNSKFIYYKNFDIEKNKKEMYIAESKYNNVNINKEIEDFKVQNRDRLNYLNEIMNKNKDILPSKYLERYNTIIQIIDDKRAYSINDAINVMIADDKANELIRAQNEANNILRRHLEEKREKEIELENEFRKELISKVNEVKEIEEQNKKSLESAGWFQCNGCVHYCDCRSEVKDNNIGHCAAYYPK